MHWKYEDVGQLPQHVYKVLVEMLNRESDRERERLAAAASD